MTERYEAGWGRDADRKLCFLHTESICPFLMDMCYYCKRSLGDIPLQSVRGCWWWRPAHPMRPRGAPPQLAWPSQGALPASVTWACRCSTIHLWEATQQSVKLTPHKLRTNAGRTHPQEYLNIWSRLNCTTSKVKRPTRLKIYCSYIYLFIIGTINRDLFFF